MERENLNTDTRHIPAPTEDDLKFFADHPHITDPGIKQRIVIERAIVRRAVTDIVAAGHLVRLHDGEDWATARTNDVAKVMAELMATDEESISILGSEMEGPYRIGVIWLVYGNDGWDVIADNTDNEITNKLLAGASEYADQLCEAMNAAPAGKHAEQGTPGPWTIEEDEDDRNQLLIKASDARGDWTVGTVNLCMGEESRANARLIVAAPDQHASLIESADAMECAAREALAYLPEGACVPEWITRLQHAASQALAAIAKATGGKQ